MKNVKKASAARLAALWCGVFGLIACSDSEHPNEGGTATLPTVRTLVAEYDKQGVALDGEEQIDHIQACQFVDGSLAHVYDNLEFGHAGCQIQLTDYQGSLYVLANTEGLIDLHDLHDRNITEEEWKQTVLSLKDDKEAHFFSGSLNLDEHDKSQVELPLSIKRGVSRFDVDIQTAGITSIKSITLKNVARNVFLFSNPGAHSPTLVERRDTTITFSQPLTEDKAGVLYVYEQANDGLEITVNAVIDGQEKTLSSPLSGHIRRNTINKIIVRKDYISVNLNVTLDEWEPGNDTELEVQNS